MTNSKGIEAFVGLCFSKRCTSFNTVKSVCELVSEYYEFGMNCDPVTPLTGEHAIVPIARWLAELHTRGPTVPRKGRYALGVFGEALGVEFPIGRPAILSCARTIKSKPTRNAPRIPVDFAKLLELSTENKEFPPLKRVFCALTLLQIYASLRYIDTCYVSQLFVTNSAICGVSVDMKSPNGEIIQWAAPLNGITEAKWREPVLLRWKQVEPEEKGKTTPLYPGVGKNWMLGKKEATRGSVQSTITKIEKGFGFKFGIRIHSPRAWRATLSKQLLYSREGREKLGRWAPGSLMPDLYDRATCATELRLRGEITQRLRRGGRR